ncbi:MAG: glycoside hydrolase family 65 protein, partial [Bacteroidetes bacterium]
SFNERSETADWKEKILKIYLPEDKKKGIFLQQDGYLDKEQTLVVDLNSSIRPLNQNWSWDRILRSPFIKQADVLQGMYFFENDFDKDTVERNFDFYEKRTVHESSLSPCLHSIIASDLGKRKMAYDFYLQTARLDLDDYNHEADEGCHITSMAGTWMSVIQGFGGMRVKDNQLQFRPYTPDKWTSYSFKIRFRGHLLAINIGKKTVEIKNTYDKAISLMVNEKQVEIPANKSVKVE